jgi:hypothetical protein
MLTDISRWSRTPGTAVVPSRWQRQRASEMVAVVRSVFLSRVERKVYSLYPAGQSAATSSAGLTRFCTWRCPRRRQGADRHAITVQMVVRTPEHQPMKRRAPAYSRANDGVDIAIVWTVLPVLGACTILPLPA